MSDISAVKALVFDVFGTVVDWRTSLIADFTRWGDTRGKKADWTALVDGWRAVYAASMDDVRKHPERGYVILDTLHRRSLEKLVEQLSITGLTDDDLHYLTMGWHRLHPWPDSVAGLTRLKTKFIISPLSNGNVALLTNMAKFAGLPWDLVLSAELFEHYKPDPETYLGAAAGHDGGRAQPRFEGRPETGIEDRLRRAPDRIWPAAEIRFRGQGRLGHRGEGFWRDSRSDGVLGNFERRPTLR
jgi:2-haloacid dehalogenase